MRVRIVSNTIANLRERHPTTMYVRDITEVGVQEQIFSPFMLAFKK